MNKVTLHHILKGFLPTPFFFFLSILLPMTLVRYTNIGPVRDGQPVVSGWSEVVAWTLFALMALGFVYSVRQAWKLRGKARYGMILGILLMLPVQYALILGTLIGMFGK
jgi:hypothetical protein